MRGAEMFVGGRPRRSSPAGAGAPERKRRLEGQVGWHPRPHKVHDVTVLVAYVPCYGSMMVTERKQRVDSMVGPLEHTVSASPSRTPPITTGDFNETFGMTTGAEQRERERERGERERDGHCLCTD